ncbi:hypothetical protein DL93DRAFT_999209 [Clavulina sp. PMI_390]|nr:hypothetical protein DL93DRAFT_999209 [Clavulina sp. PMI_390]
MTSCCGVLECDHSLQLCSARGRQTHRRDGEWEGRRVGHWHDICLIEAIVRPGQSWGGLHVVNTGLGRTSHSSTSFVSGVPDHILGTEESDRTAAPPSYVHIRLQSGVTDGNFEPSFTIRSLASLRALVVAPLAQNVVIRDTKPIMGTSVATAVLPLCCKMVMMMGCGGHRG